MGRKKTDKIVFENVEILDAGAKGVSVAKAPDGKVIFIPNVVPGDVVDIQTMKKRKAYYEGKALKIHEFSEHRIDSVCEHFGVCGGCKWQKMKYSQQLFYKNQEVYNNLKISQFKTEERYICPDSILLLGIIISHEPSSTCPIEPITNHLS